MQEIHEAIKLMEQNKTEEAIDRLETYLPLANEEEKYTIGELYMQWGMLEEAKFIFQALSEQYPKEAELKILLAEIHIDLDEDEEAIDVLNRFSPEDEEYMEALVQLADLYQAQGLFEVSEQKLLEAKNFDPTEPVIDFALGELAFSTGEYQKSIPYYEKVAEVQPVISDIEIAARLAEAYAATGEFEKAIEHYQEMESENPDNLFKYGFTAYRAQRPDIAINIWEQVIKSDPYYQSVYLYLAQTYESEGMVEEAYETAKKGLKADEFNKELYHLAGVLALKLGHQEESYKLVEEAVAMDPGFKEAVLFLIETYKGNSDYEAIIELLSRLLENGEEDANYRWELARAYQETESYQDALIQYQTAYNNFTEDPDFLKEFGYFLVEEGRIREAKEVFAKYLKLEPSDTEVEEYLSRLTETEDF
ncbi:tetratricopeptide repeat protein [Sediminibacillus halophilus]|uniref:Tetratricopeptide repeat-containing protein n=1 Tax=Sediminibacillus halophilus TaxID=482461 RepID=A0A1G9LXJ2_9BACI|nr:tetratricopeptide repeat protein [Sediminibacillus halophilus]SDL66708.1 Tetratricopeptide repeat-containing protein [Sediminibacillus halophilus]